LSICAWCAGGIDTMLEDDFLYPEDRCEA
jgi:hypothetical protein